MEKLLSQETVQLAILITSVVLAVALWSLANSFIEHQNFKECLKYANEVAECHQK